MSTCKFCGEQYENWDAHPCSTQAIPAHPPALPQREPSKRSLERANRINGHANQAIPNQPLPCLCSQCKSLAAEFDAAVREAAERIDSPAPSGMTPSGFGQSPAPACDVYTELCKPGTDIKIRLACVRQLNHKEPHAYELLTWPSNLPAPLTGSTRLREVAEAILAKSDRNMRCWGCATMQVEPIGGPEYGPHPHDKDCFIERLRAALSLREPASEAATMAFKDDYLPTPDTSNAKLLRLNKAAQPSAYKEALTEACSEILKTVMDAMADPEGGIGIDQVYALVDGRIGRFVAAAPPIGESLLWGRKEPHVMQNGFKRLQEIEPELAKHLMDEVLEHGAIAVHLGHHRMQERAGESVRQLWKRTELVKSVVKQHMFDGEYSRFEKALEAALAAASAGPERKGDGG